MIKVMLSKSMMMSAQTTLRQEYQEGVALTQFRLLISL